MVISRREFLENSARAFAGAPLLRPKDWLRIATLDTSIKYGFATDRIIARRQPVTTAEQIADSYQKGALLRFRETIGYDDQVWLQIVNDTRILVPNRPLAHGDLFITREKIEFLQPKDIAPLSQDTPKEDKRIEVSLARPQNLVAYEGSQIFLASPITAGLYAGWTPTGDNFEALWSTKARYMQGNTYDYPGVPWVVYFTNLGHAIHGAYWRKEKDFGRPGSHGCINLPIEKANLIFRWAQPGTRVSIHY